MTSLTAGSPGKSVKTSQRQRVQTLPRQRLRLSPRLIPGIVIVALSGVVLWAALARLENVSAPSLAPPAIAKAALTFTDLNNGGISVRNVGGRVVATIPARDDGFLRMTLRLLAAARLRQHIGQQQPFILTEFPGGRMLLADPTTGLSIELEAFGPSNVGEFTHFFTQAAGA